MQERNMRSEGILLPSWLFLHLSLLEFLIFLFVLVQRFFVFFDFLVEQKNCS